MAKDRSLVRASDIGSWAFCNRAWWLATVKKAEHGNPSVLTRGTESHESHGRLVTRAVRLRRIGTLLVLLGALAAIVFLFLLVTGGP